MNRLWAGSIARLQGATDGPGEEMGVVAWRVEWREMGGLRMLFGRKVVKGTQNVQAGGYESKSEDQDDTGVLLSPWEEGVPEEMGRNGNVMLSLRYVVDS